MRRKICAQKKGGIAEKMGIKYCPNITTLSLRNHSGHGPSKCSDEMFLRQGSKEPLKFKPIDKEEIKIFVDLDDEILADSKISPEEEYLKNHRRHMEGGNHEVKLIQDVVVPDVIQRLKEEDEKTIEGTKKFLEKLKKSR
ncbi:hypothetical protein KJ934_00450 [Patescibacteria group bacterium]|nr:hypothetical protein [Patescibacteria group bacterium]